MPYKNIHWIKLEKRLLNDYRFFTMSEDAQLVFVKLLMYAAASGNHMVRKREVLVSVLRYNSDPSKLQVAIDEIRANFPKFKANRYYYYFKEFENRLNWTVEDTKKELPRNSLGTPKEGTDKSKIKSKIKIKNKIREEEKLTPSKEMKLFIERGDFFKGLVDYVLEKTNLPKDAIEKEFDNFIGYWTERNKSGTKQRWELEKTFEIKRRLSTWFKNAGKFNSNKKGKTILI